MNQDPGNFNPLSKKEQSETLDWRNFLPAPPCIEKRLTSLGLYFCRTCVENAKHTGTLENGYLIYAAADLPCNFILTTKSGVEVGQLSQDDIIITSPYSQLSWEITGKGKLTCIYLSLSYIRQVISSLGMAVTEQPLIKGSFLRHDRLASELLTAIAEETKNGNYRDQVYIEAMARALCVHLLHSSLGHKAPKDYERTLNFEQMEKIRARIIEHLENRIFSADLAQCVHISEYHFYRLFRRTTGITPQRFVKNIRLERARFMLEHTQLNLYEIAYKTGFSDHSHFSREFRSQFGVSPRLLRDRLQYDHNLTLAL